MLSVLCKETYNKLTDKKMCSYLVASTQNQTGCTVFGQFIGEKQSTQVHFLKDFFKVKKLRPHLDMVKP